MRGSKFKVSRAIAPRAAPCVWTVRCLCYGDRMKSTRYFFAAALLLTTACSAVSLQGDFAAGRQAFLRGDPASAGTYFGRVAQADPQYKSETVVMRESIWTYLGRAQYDSGRFPEARENFERALSYVNDDHLARLYLGLVLLKAPVVAPATKP